MSTFHNETRKGSDARDGGVAPSRQPMLRFQVAFGRAAHACLAKENANPKVHSTRSNHVEGITYGCGMHVAISSFEGGEGSVSNGEQYADLILDHDRLGLDFPLRWYQDNACNQLRHLLMELVRFCIYGFGVLEQDFQHRALGVNYDARARHRRGSISLPSRAC